MKHDTRFEILLLAAVVAVALGLRLWGIGFGLPYDLTADEPHQIVQALKIGVGQGGPLVRMWHTIGKSGLDYLLFGEYAVLFLAWRVIGVVDNSRDFALRYLTEPTMFYMVGRVTVAVLGALTSAAVFVVGRRLYDAPSGLVAALIAAVAYHPVAASHVINVHIPMAFALWSGVAVYLVFEQSGRLRLLVVSGLLCGAAVALAYSAAAGLAMVFAARLTAPTRPGEGWQMRIRDLSILSGAALVSIALMSPNLITGAFLLARNFAAPASAGGGVRAAIDSVTILRQPDPTGVMSLLLKPATVAATIGAIVGIVAGVIRRERWTLLLATTTSLFILLVSISNRGLSEFYLLPVMPAVWLLAGRGINALSLNRPALRLAGAVAICAVPLFVTVRENVMLSKPDTRVLAKQWIEANVPAGSKILMDGMRFRFVQGAPLNGNRATLDRRLADLENSELTLSNEMLELYREAAARVTGPAYDLHSTVYGLEVQELDHYVHAGFSHVVVSSFNEKRYESSEAIKQHPASARFYREIRNDPRFHAVYTIEPIMWQQLGPTITVYQVDCEQPLQQEAVR